MNKVVATTLLAVLLVLCNVADAGFIEDYKAQHPRRVKTTTEQMNSGQYYTKTEFKLFDRNLEAGRLKLSVSLNTKGPDLCFLVFATPGSSSTYVPSTLSWGDGEKAHDIKLFFRYLTRTGHRRYAGLAMAHIRPDELKDAIVISADNDVIMNQTHKRWNEWKEALDTADKLMKDRLRYLGEQKNRQQ